MAACLNPFGRTSFVPPNKWLEVDCGYVVAAGIMSAHLIFSSAMNTAVVPDLTDFSFTIAGVPGYVPTNIFWVGGNHLQLTVGAYDQRPFGVPFSYANSAGLLSTAAGYRYSNVTDLICTADN